jgi:hypothetical protein
VRSSECIKGAYKPITMDEVHLEVVDPSESRRPVTLRGVQVVRQKPTRLWCIGHSIRQNFLLARMVVNVKQLLSSSELQ